MKKTASYLIYAISGAKPNIVRREQKNGPVLAGLFPLKNHIFANIIY